MGHEFYLCIGNAKLGKPGAQLVGQVCQTLHSSSVQFSGHVISLDGGCFQFPLQFIQTRSIIHCFF